MANVFEALEAEWARIGRDRTAAGRLAAVRREAGGACTLADVERYVRAASPPDADRVLLAVVSHVVGDDVPAATARLAARVLLQLLLPGTRKLARKWWALGDRDERAAAAVAAVYHHVCTYPLQRRPGRVAANILMDASYDLGRLVPKVIAVPVEDPAVLRRPGAAVAESTPHAAEELAEALRDAVADGTLQPADAELIARTRIGGENVNDIAAERCRTARTLWHRRQHAEARLSNLTLGIAG